MENEVMKTQNATPTRDIQTITAEIKDICRQAHSMALLYAIEIGRRLEEAKLMLPHGQWGEWLKTEVEFSQSTNFYFWGIGKFTIDCEFALYKGIATTCSA